MEKQLRKNAYGKKVFQVVENKKAWKTDEELERIKDEDRNSMIMSDIEEDEKENMSKEQKEDII